MHACVRASYRPFSLAAQLDVRVVDARYEPSQAPRDNDDDDDDPRRGRRPPPLALTQVLLSLVDESGEVVGRPAWCDVHELLENLSKDMVYTPTFAAEGDLRRRKRLELHRTEQRRLALHHLRMQTRKHVPTAWGDSAMGEVGEPGDLPAAGSPRSGASHDGVAGLLQQLQEAAPSRLIAHEDHQRNEAVRMEQMYGDESAAAAASARGGKKPLKGKRVGSAGAAPRWRGGTAPKPFGLSPSEGQLRVDRLGRAL